MALREDLARDDPNNRQVQETDLAVASEKLGVSQHALLGGDQDSEADKSYLASLATGTIS